MAQKRFYIVVFIPAVICFLLFSVFSHAQDVDPSRWFSFINSDDNPVVTDTFRLQTFSGDFSDNWTYEMSKGATLFDARAEEIADASAGLAVKLPRGSSLKMVKLPAWAHDNVKITVVYAAKNVKQNTSLMVSVDRKTEPLNNKSWVNANKDNYTAFFQQKKEGAIFSSPYILVVKNPKNITLDVSGLPSDTYPGYFAVDSAYVTRTIADFSLFTGEGDWGAHDCWTNFPVNQRRSALINGHARVNIPIRCNRLWIGYGSVGIAEGEIVKPWQLAFCSEEASLYSAGQIEVGGEVVVHKTFPEKGKWYFISFPFDVYPEGIDPGFTLEDDSFQGSGNSFYVQVYNGEKRFLSEGSSPAWEVVPSEKANENVPLFEKNKGYLIALDEKAGRQTLSFTGRGKDIPVDFGQEGSVPVAVSPWQAGKGEAHYGWYLCGNPVPAFLPLSRIDPNRDLDGYVYVYEGGKFKAYPLDSDYVLPPFSAFFVKAERNTYLTVRENGFKPEGRLIAVSGFSPEAKQEPHASPTGTTSISLPPERVAKSCIVGNTLVIEDLPVPGTIYLLDVAGRVIRRQKISAGSSVIPLSVVSGMYLLFVDANVYKAQHKFICY